MYDLSIEKKELTCILINVITAKMLFSYPRGMVENAGNAAWLQTVFVSLISCLIFWLVISLYKKAQMKSIIEISGEIGGKWLKIIVGIALTALLLFNASLTMRNLPESIKTVLLPLTPMRLILLIMALAVAFGAYMGIFSIARIHSIIIPASGVFLALFIILLLPNADITNLFPILGEGTYNIFVEGLSSLGIFTDVIILFILLPMCKNHERVKSAAHSALIISSIINVLIVLFYNLVYSYPSSREFMFPVYQMTRLIKIGDFFQRLEAFFEFIWSLDVLLYSSLYLFCFCRIWQEAFDLKYYKPLILPFCVIMSAVSFLPSSTVTMLSMQRISSLILIPTTFLIPTILVLIFNKKKLRDTK